MKNKCTSPGTTGSIVGEILQLFNSVGGDSCQFIPRSANKLAHILAKS